MKEDLDTYVGCLAIAVLVVTLISLLAYAVFGGH